MARNRDYKAEYARRIASAAKRGLSRSQARGHARRGEATVRTPPAADPAKLEAAFKSMRETGSQTAAAKAHNISPERLRRFVREKALAERNGRGWIFTDARSRQMVVISNGEVHHSTLAGFDQASLNGRHLNAVQKFIRSNDIDLLRPFEGAVVVDSSGKAHPLETNPNALHRIAAMGEPSFPEIYRITQ